MPQFLSCPRGHRWESSAGEVMTSATVVCPICGASGVMADPSPSEAANGSVEETLLPPGPSQMGTFQNTKQILHPKPEEKTEPPAPPEPAPAPGIDSHAETLMPAHPPEAKSEGSGPVDPLGQTAMSAGGILRQSGTRTEPVRPMAAPDRVNVPGYEIQGLLGRGGMGVVYKALQVRLNRLVALKMTLGGAQADPQELARFRIEAEAVARLQHPNIVQIYEVGEHDGRPYFSLEFLEGGSLDRKIKGNPMPPREAAGLMEKLAQGVFAAHQRGIIHRDLKPANVLLAADGTPKITDFGLAKRLEEDQGQTRTGAIMGTPSYMAPEQASGKSDELGTPADIYALGAILYDLLTGQPPFRGATVLDTLSQVRSVEPVRPTRLQPGVPVDLETICLKCLEKEPAKRYATAMELGEDLHRYLAGEPIRARPTPLLERVQKWARRRPAAAALVALCCALVVGLVVGGPALALYFSRVANKETTLRKDAEDAKKLADDNFHKAEEARKQADENFQQAEENFQQVQGAMDQLTEVGQQRLANVPGMEKVREELLSRALAFYKRFLSKKSDNPAVRWQSGRAFVRVGDIETMLENNDAARDAYLQARQLFEGLVKQFPDDPKYAEDLAACQNNLGNLLRESNDLNGAREAYDEALKWRQQLAERYPAVRAYRQETAGSFNNLGNLLRESNPAESEAAYRHALELQAALVQEDADEPVYRQEQARSFNNLGNVLGDAGRIQEAKKAVLQGRDLLELLVKRFTTVADYQRELAVSYNHLGNLMRDTDPGESEKAFRRSLELTGDLIQKFPLIPVFQQDLGVGQNNLGILLQAEGRSQDAAKAYGDALKTRKELAERFPKPDYQRDLAKSSTNWGLWLQDQNQPDKAQQEYGKALDLLTPLTTRFPNRVDYQHELGRTYLNLGSLRQSTGQAQKADEAFRKALDIGTRLVAQKATPEFEQDLGRVYSNLGLLEQQTRRYAEADQAYGQAVDRLTRLVKESPEALDYQYDLAVSHLNRGGLKRITGHLEAAEPDLRQATDLLAKLNGTNPGRPGYRQQLARVDNELGICLVGIGGRSDEAKQLFEKALALQGKLADDFPERPNYRQELARSQNNLGILLARTNRKDEAQPHFEKAVALLKELQGQLPNQPDSWREDLIDGYTNLGGLLARKGPRQEEEAIGIWRLAVDLQRQQVAAFPAVPEYQKALVQNLNDLGRLLLRHNQQAEANRLLQEALSYQQAALDGDPKDAAYREAVLARAEALVLLGDHAKAARLVTTLARSAPAGWPEAPRAAATLASCVARAKEDTAFHAEADRQLVMKAYGDQAVQLLRQALEHGFEDLDYLRSPVFEAIQGREDFKALLSPSPKPKTTFLGGRIENEG